MNHNTRRFPRLVSLSVLFLLLALGGADCKTGIDAQSRDCPDCVVDLRDLVQQKASEYPAEIAYGSLTAIAGSMAGNPEALLEKTVIEPLTKLLELPKANFEESQRKTLEDGVNQWLIRLNKDIRPVLKDAEKSAAAARQAMAAMKQYLAKNSEFHLALKDFTALCSDPQITSPCSELADKAFKGFEDLFRAIVFNTAALPQSTAIAYVKNIARQIRQLRVNLSNSFVIEDMKKAAAAGVALTDVDTSVGSLKTYIGAMTQQGLVAKKCVAGVSELIERLNKLKLDYVDQARSTEQPQAQRLWQGAMDAAESLKSLFAEYDTHEETNKEPSDPDPKLRALREEAFGDLASKRAGGAEKTVEDAQDLVTLEEQLLRNRVVILPANESTRSLLVAFARWIDGKQNQNVERIDSSYIFDPEALRLDQERVGIKTDQREAYILSQARKAYLSKTRDPSGARYKPVFVIYPDDLGTVNFSKLLKQFDDSRIIIGTNNTAAYAGKGTLVKLNGPTVLEASVVAHAVGQMLLQGQERADLESLADAVAKVLTALGKRDIPSLFKAMETVVAGLPPHRLNDFEVSRWVAEALAKSLDMSRDEIERSGVFGASLHQVKEVLSRIPAFYQIKAKTGISTPSGEEVRTIFEQEKLRLRALEQKIKLTNAVTAVDAALKAKADGVFPGGITGNIVANKIAQDDAKIGNEFKKIEDTASKCSTDADAESLTADVMKQFQFKGKKRFGLVARQAMWEEDLEAPKAPDDPLRGNVSDASLQKSPAPPGLISCLFLTKRDSDRARRDFAQIQRAIQNASQVLRDGATACVEGSDAEACLLKWLKSFESVRRGLSAPDGMLAQALNFSGFSVNSKKPSKNKEFWAKKIPAKDAKDYFEPTETKSPRTLGDYLSSSNKNFASAASLLNRNYYAKALLQITGTDDGRVQILPPASGVTVIKDLAQLETKDAGQQIFLKALLEDFDDNSALAIRSRRGVNQVYNQVLQHQIAKLLALEVKKMQTVVNGFWDLSNRNLSFFQEDSEVWIAADRLASKIQAVAVALKDDFVQTWDGGLAGGTPASPVKLFALSQALGDLHTSLGDVRNALSRLFNQSERTAVNELKTSIEEWLIRNDVRGMPKDEKGQAWVTPPVATSAQAFRKLFESAYDVHVFTYFKKDKTPASNATYKIWENTAGRLFGEPIKHPLEPK